MRRTPEKAVNMHGKLEDIALYAVLL